MITEHTEWEQTVCIAVCLIIFAIISVCAIYTGRMSKGQLLQGHKGCDNVYHFGVDKNAIDNYMRRKQDMLR